MNYTDKLPEKWRIKVTKENIVALGKWRDSGPLDNMHINSLYILSLYNGAKGWGAHLNDEYIMSDYTDITFEDFQVHILKETPKFTGYELY